MLWKKNPIFKRQENLDTYPPKNKRMIGNKRVFKTKFDGVGQEVRKKARLVVKGYTQKFADLEEIFSPVVCMQPLEIYLQQQHTKILEFTT